MMDIKLFTSKIVEIIYSTFSFSHTKYSVLIYE